MRLIIALMAVVTVAGALTFIFSFFYRFKMWEKQQAQRAAEWEKRSKELADQLRREIRGE